MAGLQPVYLDGLSKSELISMVDSFCLDRDSHMMLKRRGPDSWCITNGSSVLNTDFEMEWEPSPSNRDDDFILRTRFPLDEAFRQWNRFCAVRNEKLKAVRSEKGPL